jgi:hypothetical protein
MNCAGQEVTMIEKASSFVREVIGKCNHRLASNLRSRILAVTTGGPLGGSVSYCEVSSGVDRG